MACQLVTVTRADHQRQGGEEEAHPQQHHRPQGEGAGDYEFLIGPLLG